MIGTKLASYEITRSLGRGGMGEVYLARDSKLDRDVAIKVLPESMMRDPERAARFEREAKLLASLNHPNIAAIYGFDDANGTRFLAMEYVEGEDLASHLDNGPVAVEDALEIGKQIAEALEAAHEQGVIHRDLKPANVVLRKDGTVKVLDFGLAKALAEEASSINAPSIDSPTITANYTKPGVVLGTAAYMSPEQARGRPLDKRTDIWSFGIILFECLTGVRLFAGETANDSMGAIMHKEPDWSLLPPGTPPTVQLLLRRCLTKDRKRRLHDIADARIEIENALVDPSSTSLGLAQAAIHAGKSSRVWSVVPWVVASAALLALAIIVSQHQTSAVPVVTHVTVDLPEETELIGWPSPVLSSDGKFLLLAGRNDSRSQLLLREMDSGRCRFIDETKRAFEFSTSPDNQWVVFAQRRKLRKLSLLGGPATTVCELSSGRGQTWLADGSIIVALNRVGGLSLIPSNGGPPVPFTKIEEGTKATSHRHPFPLPEGKGVFFNATQDAADWESSSLMYAPLDGGPSRVLVDEAVHGRYVPPGYLVFMRRNTLLAAPFDLDRVEITGDALPVVEDVSCPIASAPAQFSISDNGTLVYIPDTETEQKTFVKIDFDGNATPLSTATGNFDNFAVSPDGTRIAVIIDNDTGREDFMVLDIRRNLLRPLVVGEGSFSAPVWSPDGKWIIFGSNHESDELNLYRIRSDFSGSAESLGRSDKLQVPSAWSPDGRSIVFIEVQESGAELLLLRLDEEGVPIGGPEEFIDRPKWQCCVEFSPDGQWVVYGSGETGSSQVFVRAVDGGTATEQISIGNRVDEAAFSPIENKILFEARGSGDGQSVFAIDYTISDGRLEVAADPLELFAVDSSIELPDGVQLMPDGKHLVGLKRTQGPLARTDPKIIINWFEQVRAKVPLD